MPISESKRRFKEMLANCYYWRNWPDFGISWSVDEAKQHIYIDDLPPPPSGADVYSRSDLETMRPFAIIGRPGDLQATAASAVGGFTFTGPLTAQMEYNVPRELSRNHAELTRIADDLASNIICTGDPAKPGLTELQLNAGNSGFLEFISITAEGPHRIAEDGIPTQGDCMWYFVDVQWGAGAP